MTWLTLNGKVFNVLHTPAGQKKDGEKYGDKDRVQIMVEKRLQNDEVLFDLIDLTVENISVYKPLLGQMVSIPVGAFVSGKGIQFYALKGVSPEVRS